MYSNLKFYLKDRFIVFMVTLFIFFKGMFNKLKGLSHLNIFFNYHHCLKEYWILFLIVKRKRQIKKVQWTDCYNQTYVHKVEELSICILSIHTHLHFHQIYMWIAKYITFTRQNLSKDVQSIEIETSCHCHTQIFGNISF